VPKLDEGDDFEAAVNPVTKVESRAWGEPAMRDLLEFLTVKPK